MTAWVEQSWANVAILGLVTVAVTAVLLAAFDAAPFHRHRREPDWPPEWEPDLEPDEDGVYADARAEMDQWWAELEDRDADT